MITGRVQGQLAQFCDPACKDAFRHDRMQGLAYGAIYTDKPSKGGRAISPEAYSLISGFCVYCGTRKPDETRTFDVIVDWQSGRAVQVSRNLRGIREYTGKHTAKLVAIVRNEDGTGQLHIDFERAWFKTVFADYGVLVRCVRDWRNLVGARLMENGQILGMIGHTGKPVPEYTGGTGK